MVEDVTSSHRGRERERYIMDRRKFMLGIGGSALGGSALLGSGAFSRIESQRTVDIKVAHDEDAYLGLVRKDPNEYPNASYVDYDEKGHLRLRFNEENETEGGGIGFNSNSMTFVDDMFAVRNQGKQPVTVCLDPSDLEITPDDEREGQTEDAEDVVIFYKGIAKGSRGLDGIIPIHCHDRNEDHAGDATGEGYCWDRLGESHTHELGVGEELQVGMLMCTKESSLGDSTEISGEVRFVADASKRADQPEEPPEPPEPPEDISDTAISFVAFCPAVGVATIEAILNDDGDPIGISWVTNSPPEEVILKGGQEWYRYDVDGETSGVAWMSESEADAFYESGSPFSFGDDPAGTERCPPSPCAGVAGTKINEEDGEFDPADAETTRVDCP